MRTATTGCAVLTCRNSPSTGRSGFDWRAAERAINAYEHYRADVGGVPVHFMRKPGAGPDPVPLILSHGWPWTFWHWSRVIGPLADPAAYGGDPADSFDVIVPSLPGFGFSTPLAGGPDMNFWKIADVWHELMTGSSATAATPPQAATSVRWSPASSATSTPLSSTPSTSGPR